MRDQITDPFQTSAEVWEWISNLLDMCRLHIHAGIKLNRHVDEKGPRHPPIGQRRHGWCRYPDAKKAPGHQQSPWWLNCARASHESKYATIHMAPQALDCSRGIWRSWTHGFLTARTPHAIILVSRDMNIMAHEYTSYIYRLLLVRFDFIGLPQANGYGHVLVSWAIVGSNNVWMHIWHQANV